MPQSRSAFAALFVLVASGAAFAADVDVIVGFKVAPDADVIEKKGGKVADLKLGKALAARVPASAVASLRADPNVAYVEEDGIVEILGEVDKSAKPGGGGGSTQPAQSPPWGVTRVNGGVSQATWGAVNVAVVDTGVDLDHPDLVANVGAAAKFVSTAKSADDDNGHGSHVAGTIAAADNTIGVIGVAPKAKILVAKVLDRSGSGTWSGVASGIRWAADNGANIANMSLGASSGNSTLQTACDYAAGKGTLLIAAAGNSGDGSTTTPEISYPAAYGNVVAVGATRSGDTLASFSNSSDYVDIAAPGVSVYSTYKNAGYATLQGTSMASPHAAGVAALIWSYLSRSGGTTDRVAVRSALESDASAPVTKTYDPNGWGYGAGIAYFAH